MTDNETLPAILSINIEEPIAVQANDTLENVIKADVAVANDMLRVVHSCFGEAKSIGSICNLIDTTMGLLEKRRKLMRLPYGAPSESRHGDVIFPLS